jgi:hydrogenase maturation protease
VTRIIGVGNPDRGDDAAGLEVARRLRVVHGIEARECPGGLTDLLDAWHGADDVIVVDAMASGRAPGAVTRFDAAAGPLPATRSGASTHGLGVAEAVELARVLGRLPARLAVWGIEGVEFTVGAPLTPAVAEAVAEVAAELAESAARPPGGDS